MGDLRFLVADEPNARPVAEFVTAAAPTAAVTAVEGFDDAISELRSGTYDLLVVADLLDRGSGLELVRRARVERPWMRALVVTGHDGEDRTVEALAAGAVDCLPTERGWRARLGPVLLDALAGRFPGRGSRMGALVDAAGVAASPPAAVDAIVDRVPAALEATGAAVWISHPSGSWSGRTGGGMPRDPGALAAILPRRLAMEGRMASGVSTGPPVWDGAPPHVAAARIGRGRLTVSVAVGSGEPLPAGAESDVRAVTAWVTRTIHGLVRRSGEAEVAGPDPETGLSNEAALLDQLRAEAARGSAPGYRAALILVRVEAIEVLCERLGLSRGEAMARAGRALCSALRRYDHPNRSGPDELAALLPRAGIEQGAAVARRVQEMIAGALPGPHRPLVAVAAYPQSVRSVSGLLEAAREGLVAARASGEDVHVLPPRGSHQGPGARLEPDTL